MIGGFILFCQKIAMQKRRGNQKKAIEVTVSINEVIISFKNIVVY
jgi:hypothetical protein